MSAPKFDNQSLLSPALLMAEFETAHGATFDVFSYLDPLRRQKQIEAKVGKTVFSNYKGILDPTWSPDGLSAAIG